MHVVLFFFFQIDGLRIDSQKGDYQLRRYEIFLWLMRCTSKWLFKSVTLNLQGHQNAGSLWVLAKFNYIREQVFLCKNFSSLQISQFTLAFTYWFPLLLLSVSCPLFFLNFFHLQKANLKYQFTHRLSFNYLQPLPIREPKNPNTQLVQAPSIHRTVHRNSGVTHKPSGSPPLPSQTVFLQRLAAWGCVFCLPLPFPAAQGFACRVSINVDNLGPLPSFTSWVTGSAKEKMAQRSPHQVGFEKSPSFQHILSPGPPQKPLNYYAECIQLEQTTHSSRSHDLWAVTRVPPSRWGDDEGDWMPKTGM